MESDHSDRHRGLLVAVLLGLAIPLPIAGCRSESTPRDPHVVRIMPLGDSITQGASGMESYRRGLWLRLTAAGIRCDFVGSMRSNYRGPAAHDDYDPDHEGHWGWQADEVLARIDRWVADADPDIVLMHLGTNDLGYGQDTDGIVMELAEIVARLRSRNPSIKVLVARIIPIAHAAGVLRIAQLNRRIDDMARKLTTRTSPVLAVDQFEGFDATRDTYDGIHPNDAGAEKMAARWYAALLEVIRQ